MGTDMNTYQHRIQQTQQLPDHSTLEYLALGLLADAGQVAGRTQKAVRECGGIVDADTFVDLQRNLGDVLVGVAALATHLGVSMNSLAQTSLDRLEGVDGGY